MPKKKLARHARPNQSSKRNPAKKTTHQQKVTRAKASAAGKATRKKKPASSKVTRTQQGSPARKTVRTKKSPGQRMTNPAKVVMRGASLPVGSKELSGNTAISINDLELQDLETDAAGQAGDTQGLSRLADADSESVQELVEEGQAFEAGIISGVEDARNADEAEVTTKEVPEDDVPQEESERN